MEELPENDQIGVEILSVEPVATRIFERDGERYYNLKYCHNPKKTEIWWHISYCINSKYQHYLITQDGVSVILLEHAYNGKFQCTHTWHVIENDAILPDRNIVREAIESYADEED